MATAPSMEPLPNFTDLDLRDISDDASHLLAPVASVLLARMLRDEPALAFYEDGPW